jgi:hypothetical protein
MDWSLHVNLLDVPTAVTVRVRLIHKLRHERTGDAGSREGEGIFEELQLVAVRVQWLRAFFGLSDAVSTSTWPRNDH